MLGKRLNLDENCCGRKGAGGGYNYVSKKGLYSEDEKDDYISLNCEIRIGGL